MCGKTGREGRVQEIPCVRDPRTRHHLSTRVSPQVKTPSRSGEGGRGVTKALSSLPPSSLIRWAQRSPPVFRDLDRAPHHPHLQLLTSVADAHVAAGGGKAEITGAIHLRVTSTSEPSGNTAGVSSRSGHWARDQSAEMRPGAGRSNSVKFRYPLYTPAPVPPLHRTQGK
jgi:hypothetical protein